MLAGDVMDTDREGNKRKGLGGKVMSSYWI